MEEKKVSELKTTTKERGRATSNVLHQVNKELGIKGRIAVVFGIAIIWLLGAIVVHVDDRHDRSFDRGNRSPMMQDRAGIMRMSQRIDDVEFPQRRFSDKQNLQGCPQQTPQSDSIFDRMQSRMNQIFGSDEKEIDQLSPLVPSIGSGAAK